jgi:hypothetical protein
MADTDGGRDGISAVGSPLKWKPEQNERVDQEKATFPAICWLLPGACCPRVGNAIVESGSIVGEGRRAIEGAMNRRIKIRVG